MEAAIGREKAIKRWRRDWKLNLIEEHNPDWEDLAIGLGFEAVAHDGKKAAPRGNDGVNM